MNFFNLSGLREPPAHFSEGPPQDRPAVHAVFLCLRMSPASLRANTVVFTNALKTKLSVSRKGLCRNPKGMFPNKLPGKVSGAFLLWIFWGLFLLFFAEKTRSAKSTPKSTANFISALGIGKVPTTPDPNTSAKVSRYKWEPYRDTNWWCIYYFLPRAGHTFAKVSR